jgi:CelD/BcsL family acetyltransferase involved in cellulose biosynthesis
VLAMTKNLPPGQCDGLIPDQGQVAELLAPIAFGTDQLSCRVLTAYEDVERCLGLWRELEASARTPVFFQSAAWCRHIMACAIRAQQPLSTRIVCAWAGGRLVGVWPLKLERVMGVRLLTDLTDPFGQYGDCVVDGRLESGPIVEAMLAAIEAYGDCDALLIRKVRADAVLAPVLKARGARINATDAAPSLALATFSSLDDIRATLSTKRRRNMRNWRNRLTRLGQVTHEVKSSGAAAQAIINQSLDLRIKQMGEQGATSRAFRSDLFAPIVANLVDTEASDLDVLAMALKLDGSNVAAQFGFVHNRRYYCYMVGRDGRYDEMSPGILHMEEALNACVEEGLLIADFLAPAVAYKQTFADHQTPIADHALALTLRGRMLVDVWQQRLRPFAKSVLDRMPVGMRRRLTPVRRSS